MYPFDEEDFEELEPVRFQPIRKMRRFNDLEGSGFSDFGEYGNYYDGDFESLTNDNYRSLVNPLDELEDEAPDGTNLEYHGRGKRK